MSQVYSRWAIAFLMNTFFMFLVACDKKVSAVDQSPESVRLRMHKDSGPRAGVQKGQVEAKEVEAKEVVGRATVKRLKPGPGAHAKLLVQAKTRYLGNDLLGAEPLFKALCALEPVSSEVVTAHIALGDIYATTHRVDEALELYSSLLQKVEDVPEVFLVIGRAYASREQFAKAVLAYKKALNLQPSFIFLWKEMGQLHARLGDNEESAHAFLKYERKVYALAKSLESFAKTPVEERLNIIDIFSMLEDDRVTQSLITALTDPEARVRAQAASTLAVVRAVSALPMLTERAKLESNNEVRTVFQRAMTTLKALGQKSVDDVVAPTQVDKKGSLP